MEKIYEYKKAMNKDARAKDARAKNSSDALTRIYDLRNINQIAT